MAPLWFLPALAYSILIIAAANRFGWGAYLLPVATALHIVGLFGHGLGVFVDVSFRASTAVFVGLFYTMLGVKFTDWETSISRKWSYVYLGIFLAGLLLRIAEVYLLGYVLGDTGMSTLADGVYTTGYTPLTILIAVFLFAFVLSHPAIGRGTRLPNLGQYAVGIYIVHPMFILGLRDILARGVATYWGFPITKTVVWHLAFTPIVFIGSLLTYLAFERVGVVEAFHTLTETALRRLQQQVGRGVNGVRAVARHHLPSILRR